MRPEVRALTFGAVAGRSDFARETECRLAAAREAIVRRALRLRRVVVQRDAQTVADGPLGIEADGVQLVALFVVLLLVTEVLAGPGPLLEKHWRRNGLVRVEDHMREAVTLHPYGLLAAVFGDVVLRKRVVECQRHRVGWRELQDTLCVDTFTLEVRECVTDVVRNTEQLAFLQRIFDDGIRSERTATAVRDRIVAPGLDVPLVHRRLNRTRIALLVARAQARAKRAVVVRVAEQTRHFRRHVAADAIRRVVNRLRAHVDDGAVVVERTRRLDIDSSADAARRDVRTASLVDLDRVDALCRELSEVERATARALAAGDHVTAAEAFGAGHLTAVQRDEVELRTEAAGGHECAFAVTTVDRHTGDTLERLGQVRVRELTDVFRIDRVYDADRVALRLHRLLQGSSQTSDHDLFQLLRLLCCKRRVDEHRATDDGEQRLSIKFRFHRVSSPQHFLDAYVFSSCGNEHRGLRAKPKRLWPQRLSVRDGNALFGLAWPASP